LEVRNKSAGNVSEGSESEKEFFDGYLFSLFRLEKITFFFFEIFKLYKLLKFF